MFRKLGHILLIVALLAAVGGHWIVLQSVAWTNMLAGNLRTDWSPRRWKKRSTVNILAAFAKRSRREKVRQENRAADTVAEN